MGSEGKGGRERGRKEGRERRRDKHSTANFTQRSRTFIKTDLLK